nr:hypothetical protein [Tanacetum cinerariifolium]
ADGRRHAQRPRHQPVEEVGHGRDAHKIGCQHEVAPKDEGEGDTAAEQVEAGEGVREVSFQASGILSWRRTLSRPRGNVDEIAGASR